jgi:hypothetical protein
MLSPYAECGISAIVMLSVVTLSVSMLSATVMLSVVTLNVVAPLKVPPPF